MIANSNCHWPQSFAHFSYAKNLQSRPQTVMNLLPHFSSNSFSNRLLLNILDGKLVRANQTQINVIERNEHGYLGKSGEKIDIGLDSCWVPGQ